MPIKPPSGFTPTITSDAASAKPAAGKTGANTAATANQAMPTINPEAVTKALKEYQKMRDKLKNPAFKGAAGLFTDNVVFPNELLDPNNPENDPRFLHLLLAVFGMKEMKQFFETEDQKKEEEESDEEETEEKLGDKKPVTNPKKKN